MELTEKEVIVTDKKNEISSLRNEIEENKEVIDHLSRELKKKMKLTRQQ